MVGDSESLEDTGCLLVSGWKFMEMSMKHRSSWSFDNCKKQAFGYHLVKPKSSSIALKNKVAGGYI